MRSLSHMYVSSAWVVHCVCICIVFIVYLFVILPHKVVQWNAHCSHLMLRAEKKSIYIFFLYWSVLYSILDPLPAVQADGDDVVCWTHTHTHTHTEYSSSLVPINKRWTVISMFTELWLAAHIGSDSTCDITVWCVCKALFRPGINIHPEGSDHKWSALTTGENMRMAPMARWRRVWDPITQRWSKQTLWNCHSKL